MNKNGVSVSKIVERLDLKVFTDNIDLKKRRITRSDINRPAIQLAGYFVHFDSSRVQVIGNVEHFYAKQLEEEKRLEIYKELLSYDIPCIIFSRNLKPMESFVQMAEERGIPVLGTSRSTSAFIAELIYELGEQLAPCITIHGVLVDVYGEGLLITGESGIGKSEAALELIRRGHRLISDDVVEITKINEHTLMGTAPEITRHFIELRGIGIIDVKTLYGVECVKEKQQIDLVIKLEDWKKDAEYDRIIDINLKGTFNCCKAAAQVMINQKSGKIINVSSMWGQVGASCEVAYSAAKAGVIGFTKALAKEVGPSGIRVNCVAPGAVDTDMNKCLDSDARAALCEETPLGRLGTPEEIARAIVFLADENSFITGQILSPNGGLVI